MSPNKVLNYLENVLDNMPTDWLHLTTHRLDIYNESLAKTEFLATFEGLYEDNNSATSALRELPTAYDYIRLGHPLSSILEWGIAKINGLQADHVISFSSQITPVLAVLRKNLLTNKNTLIAYQGELPKSFDVETIKRVYAYHFELIQVKTIADIPDFQGSTIYISKQNEVRYFKQSNQIDFFLTLYEQLGSIILVNGQHNGSYISEIQHVRRRETIAMTPSNCFMALKKLVDRSISFPDSNLYESNKSEVVKTIQEITATQSKVQLASSGLSIQYAIMMGLIEEAMEQHKGKDIKFIVPPNCYGGTNDQARRVAACIANVEIVDLPVDGENDMVQSIDKILEQVSKEDAVPYIIVEIPTNPRVEVPDLDQLRAVLSKERANSKGEKAIEPVFILDQTFCPNLQFCGENGILSSIKTISYVSGSKFPSGGKCTAGYCVANKKAASLMDNIEKHLKLCDNEATPLQVEILALQMPSMLQRIEDAYRNTRTFVNFIKKTLPSAKINFVSEELAAVGFTPSVFSLDLPTKGETLAEREAYKRELNNKLINLMISKIPTESKYCVSYGQLKGCYWTIPATSTQGTTKESDKDYIARVSVSPDLNLELHQQVFADFVKEITR